MDVYKCVNCYEPITNPICDECFMREIKSWIREKPILEKKQKEILGKIQKLMILDTPSEVSCIFCNNSYVSICSYCFFLEASKVLIRQKLDKFMVNEFLDLFNYRQGHEEYAI
jgi:hypothetical protein